MKYSDFSITIQGLDHEGQHTVRIACPEGEYEGRFTNPFSKGKLEERLTDNKLSAKSPADTKVPGGLTDIQPVASTDDLKEIGSLLYRSLFRTGVIEAFSACIGRLKEDEGLRIRIRIDPKLEQYAELMSLPWEFLYDDRRREFIGLMYKRVIVRYPEAAARIDPLEINPPLRILAVASEPSDYDALRLGKEIRSIVSILKSENIPIEIELLEQATIEALEDEVRRQTYHVFHFMGHGDYDPGLGRSTLVFEHSDGTGHQIDGEMLRLALPNSIKLVFLNACETARVGESDPFAAISTELALAGIPAVLAMQFPISDAAAVIFSRRFYACLADGTPVDQCLESGRRAIFYNPETKTEWGTPVLFMRSPDGVIFRIRTDSEQKTKSEDEQITEVKTALGTLETMRQIGLDRVLTRAQLEVSDISFAKAINSLKNEKNREFLIIGKSLEFISRQDYTLVDALESGVNLKLAIMDPSSDSCDPDFIKEAKSKARNSIDKFKKLLRTPLPRTAGTLQLRITQGIIEYSFSSFIKQGKRVSVLDFDLGEDLRLQSSFVFVNKEEEKNLAASLYSLNERKFSQARFLLAYPSPFEYVYVCALRGRKAFFVKRRGEKTWQLPGGKIESGEIPEDTVKREFLEETGYLLDVFEPLEPSEQKNLVFVGKVGSKKTDRIDDNEIEEVKLFERLPNKDGLSFPETDYKTILSVAHQRFSHFFRS